MILLRGMACIQCHQDGSIHLLRGMAAGMSGWSYLGETFCSERCLAEWLVTYKRIPNLPEELKRIREGE